MPSLLAFIYQISIVVSQIRGTDDEEVEEKTKARSKTKGKSKGKR